MNYYTYLKTQIKDHNTDFRKNKTFIALYYLNFILLFLNLLFSVFFIIYFVKLTNYVNDSFHKIVTAEWLKNQQNLNADLLICMTVFWVIYIVISIWFLYLYFNFTRNFSFIKANNKILDKLISYTFILGLFICFLALVGIISFFILIKKNDNKKKIQKNI